MNMKKISTILFLILISSMAYSQENGLYQNGLTAEQNLSAIGNLSRFANAGGTGFDNRYEGIKGSPRLFEKFLPTMLKVKGQDFFIQLETNLDLAGNLLLFNYPKTGKLMAIPSGTIEEVKINSEGKEMVFRISKESEFEREIKDGRFYQVLREGLICFIKLPVKKLIEADYKAVYSPDRRYDEYTTYYKYYIMGSGGKFQQIQLSKKSLNKLFPEAKELINKSIVENSYTNNEEMVLDIIDKISIK
jgi:hypothetical protein